jgi:hypothetical protein
MQALVEESLEKKSWWEDTRFKVENNAYPSELRALLSIRNFNAILEKHYAQLLKIGGNLEQLNKTALEVVENHLSGESGKKFNLILKEINTAIFSIRQILNTVKEKVARNTCSSSSVWWKQIDLHLAKLKKAYTNLESFGREILPESKQIYWKTDICNFRNTMLPLFVSYAEACRVELKMIESYLPTEQNQVTQVILAHIPEDFTLDEATQYEKDYLSALEDFKQEFHKKKNLWDTFLDILAGGTHQSPSEHVMMERWLEGEKRSL